MEGESSKSGTDGSVVRATTRLTDVLRADGVASNIVSYLDASKDVKRFVFQCNKHVVALLKPRVRDLKFVLEPCDLKLIGERWLASLGELRSLSIFIPRMSFPEEDSKVATSMMATNGTYLPPKLVEFRFDFNEDSHHIDPVWLQECFTRPLPQGLQSFGLFYTGVEFCERVSRCESLRHSLTELRLAVIFANSRESTVVQDMLSVLVNLEHLTLRVLSESGDPFDLSSLTRLQSLELRSTGTGILKVSHLPQSLLHLELHTKFLDEGALERSEFQLPLLEKMILQPCSDMTRVVSLCTGTPNLRSLLMRKSRNSGWCWMSFEASEFRALLEQCPRLETMEGQFCQSRETWQELSFANAHRKMTILPMSSAILRRDDTPRTASTMPPTVYIQCYPTHVSHIPVASLKSCEELVVERQVSNDGMEEGAEANPQPLYFDLLQRHCTNITRLDLAVDIYTDDDTRFDFSPFCRLSVLRLRLNPELTTRWLVDRSRSMNWFRTLRNIVYSIPSCATSISVELTRRVFSKDTTFVSKLNESSVDLHDVLRRHPNLRSLSLGCNVVGLDQHDRPLVHACLDCLSVSCWYGISRPFDVVHAQAMISITDHRATNLPKLSALSVEIVTCGYMVHEYSSATSSGDNIHHRLGQHSAFSVISTHPKWTLMSAQPPDIDDMIGAYRYMWHYAVQPS